MVKWLDRHLWTIPVILFVAVEVALVALHSSSPQYLLAAVAPDRRKDIYSSLTGSSSGLLGFSLAAVAILVAFGKRSTTRREERVREEKLAKARTGISKLLMVTSFFLTALLAFSTVGLGIDTGKVGNVFVTSVVFSSAISSVIGLLVSGSGLALSLVERSKH